MSEGSVKKIPSSNDLAVERTDLAVERSAMAAGRTLMGWVRTSLSMISFGFTIYKFLQAAGHGASANGPRRLGLFLIAMGVISVLLGSVEYHQTLTRLNKLSSRHMRTLNTTLVVGILIGLLGLFLFITILTRMEIL